MHYIETFLTIMKAADAVVRVEERSVRGRHGSSARAAAKIYREAFCELEAEGMPVAYSEDGSRYIETDGSVYFLQKEDAVETSGTAEKVRTASNAEDPASRKPTAEAARPAAQKEASAKKPVPVQETESKEPVLMEQKPDVKPVKRETDDLKRLAQDLFYPDRSGQKKEESRTAANASADSENRKPADTRIRPDQSTNIRETENALKKTAEPEKPVKEDIPVSVTESKKSGPAAGTKEDADPVLEEYDYDAMDDEEEGTTALASPRRTVSTSADRDMKAGPESTAAMQEAEDAPEETGVFSMRSGDFTMYYMSADVIGPEPGKTLSCEIIVSPLTPSGNPNDIMAILIMNSRQYAAATMKGRNGVLIEAEGIGFIIEGQDRADTFAASVRLRNLDKKAGWNAQVVTERAFGKKGHIVIHKDGTTVHIVPSSFYNNDTGNADYFCCFETDGERKTGYTANADHIPFECGGKACDLVCRWHEDGTLYAMITSPETIDLRKEAMD